MDQPLGAHADIEHVGEPHVVAAREAAAHRVELDPDHLVRLLAREHARRDELVHLLPRRVPVLLAPAQLARLEHRHPQAFENERRGEEDPDVAAAHDRVVLRRLQRRVGLVEDNVARRRQLTFSEF